MTTQATSRDAVIGPDKPRKPSTITNDTSIRTGNPRTRNERPLRPPPGTGNVMRPSTCLHHRLLPPDGVGFTCPASGHCQQGRRRRTKTRSGTTHSARKILWALGGALPVQQARGLADLDEISVRVTDVAADLRSPIDRRR